MNLWHKYHKFQNIFLNEILKKKMQWNLDHETTLIEYSVEAIEVAGILVPQEEVALAEEAEMTTKTRDKTLKTMSEV